MRYLPEIPSLLADRGGIEQVTEIVDVGVRGGAPPVRREERFG